MGSSQNLNLLGGSNPFTSQFLHPSLVKSPNPFDSPGSKTSPYFVSFLWDQVFASQIKKLRKRICWVEPTLLQVSLYNHLLYKAQDPFSTWRQSRLQYKFLFFTCFLWDQVWTSQITKLRKRICWVEPTLLQVSSFTQDSSCTKLNWSIRHMHTVQFPKQVLIFHLFCGTKSLRHRLRNWRPREFARWNKPFYKSVLTPISSSKLKIHSAYEDSPGSKTSPNFHLFCGTKSLPHRSKNSGREFVGWNHPFTGQFLHPSLVQSSGSIQHMQTVQARKRESYLVTCFFFCVCVCVCVWDQFFASPIKKFRKGIYWVEPIPIWTSSFIMHIFLVQKVHLVHAKRPSSSTSFLDNILLVWFWC